MTVVLIIGAVLCFIYFIGLLASAVSFAWIWLLFGCLFGAGAFGKWFFKNHSIPLPLPLWLKVGAMVTVILGSLIFIIVEGLIISHMFHNTDIDLDYIIILGAQVKDGEISPILEKRLDRAVVYLEEHEETMVIVAGGTGPKEVVSEARAMYWYLIGEGIAPSRITKEEKSTNTVENITFSAAIINDYSSSVGIVTSNFHIYRAEQIARNIGFNKVYGLSAESGMGLTPHYLIREFFAVLKARFLGQI